MACSYFLCLSLCLFLVGLGSGKREYPLACDDDIYCYGEILHTVQMAEPFQDRKTYVDLPLKLPRATVKSNFAAMMTNTSGNPTLQDIKAFLSSNFKERGEELTAWIPEDWKATPSFLSKIRDPQLRQFGRELNALWKELGKRIKEDVRNNPDMFSLVYIPNPVILPGGRFLELYYWDTYWIIRGLLHCEMYDSVKGMLEDFFRLIDKFGYVPNGNRIYYSRTQPPFLTQMVWEYVHATGDWDFAGVALPYLDKEFQFWLDNRSVIVTVNGKSYKMFRYNNEVTGPRPESYSREYVLAETLESTQQKDEFYINMKSAAESGWDFSTRWFPLDAPKNSSLLATRASMVIPVDLNSILYRNAGMLARLHKKFKNKKNAVNYKWRLHQLHEGFQDLLWDEKEGSWFDFDLDRKVLRKEFYPSNIFPLWAGISRDNTSAVLKIINYLERSGALTWPGGIPTSLHESGQQWDFPNAWPPLQHLFVEALANTNNEIAQDLAFDTAQKWVANNYLTYTRYNQTMFEKYRADIPGEPGGGGLYDVVVGFGWTNGVIIDFLNKYGDSLTPHRNATRYH